MIDFECENCGKKFSVKEASAGKTSKCKCGAKVRVPDPFFDDGFVLDEAETLFTPQAIGLMIAAIAALVFVLIFFLGRYKVYKSHITDIEATNFYTDGNNALNTGDAEKAYGLFEKSIKLRPEWLAAQVKRAETAVKLNKPDAPKLIERLLKKEFGPANSLWASEWLACRALKKKKKSDAADYLKEVKGSKIAPVILAVISRTKSDKKANLKAALKQKDKLDPKSKVTLARLLMYKAYKDKDEAEFLKVSKTPGIDPDEVAKMGTSLLLAKETIDPKVDAELIKLAEFTLTRAKGEQQKHLQSQLTKKYFDSGMIEQSEKNLTEEKSAGAKAMLSNIYTNRLKTETDKKKRAVLLKQNIEIYKALLEDPSQLQKRGETLVLGGISMCEEAGDKAGSDFFLKKGLSSFPENASLNLRAGRLALSNKNYEVGIKMLKKAQELDPTQEGLKEILDGFTSKPVFSQFRPSRPHELVKRPLLHVKIVSTSPFDVDYDKVMMELDGQSVKPLRGGNEYFYAVQKDVPLGLHKVKVTACDTQGNTTEQVFTFGLDGSGPVAKIVRPEGGARTVRPVIEIAIDDELSKVDPKTVSISISNGAGISFVVTSKGKFRWTDKGLGYKKGGAITSGDKVIFRAGKDLAPGMYKVKVKAADILGNYSTTTLNLRVSY